MPPADAQGVQLLYLLTLKASPRRRNSKALAMVDLTTLTPPVLALAFKAATTGKYVPGLPSCLSGLRVLRKKKNTTSKVRE